MTIIKRPSAAARRGAWLRPGNGAIRPAGVLIACAVTIAGSVWAQAAVTPRPQPQAGAVLHVTTTQELLVSAPGAGAGAGSAEIRTHSVLGFTQTNGTFDDQGRMIARLTVDRLESQQVLNGTPKPARDLTPFIGGTLTATLSRNGDLVDVTLSAQLQPMAATVKQLVAAAFGVARLLPEQELAVGGHATLDSDIPIRLPAAGDTPLRTRSVVTLRSVEGGLARFDQRITAAEASQVTLTGTGTIDVNLARGYVAASTTEWSMETAAGASPQAGTGIRAIVKVTLTATE